VSVQVAVQRARTGEGHLCLPCTHDDLRAGEVRKAAGVISVHVGHDQPAHVARLDAQALQLGTDLLLRGHPPPLARPHERMPPRLITGVVGMGALTGVNDDRTVGMFDCEAEDRETRRPVPVGEDVGHAGGPGTEP